MNVLIVESNQELAQIWARFLERQRVSVTIALNQKQAISAMRFGRFDALVLDLVLPDGGAIAISDYAAYRQPNVPIITVTDSNFFSDGSIFDLIPNARGLMRAPVNAEDLAAMLDHFGTAPAPKLARRA